jgi:hypothetical protein
MINSDVNVFRAWATAADEAPYAKAQNANEIAMETEHFMLRGTATQKVSSKNNGQKFQMKANGRRGVTFLTSRFRLLLGGHLSQDPQTAKLSSF